MLYCPTPGEHVARTKTQWPTSGGGGHEVARRTPGVMEAVELATVAGRLRWRMLMMSPGIQDAIGLTGYKSVASKLLYASYARLLRGPDSNR